MATIVARGLGSLTVAWSVRAAASQTCTLLPARHTATSGAEEPLNAEEPLIAEEPPVGAENGEEKTSLP